MQKLREFKEARIVRTTNGIIIHFDKEVWAFETNRFSNPLWSFEDAIRQVFQEEVKEDE